MLEGGWQQALTVLVVVKRPSADAELEKVALNEIARGNF